MAPFPPPCWKHEGIFLWLSSGELGGAPWGKIHECAAFPLRIGSREFLNLKLVHTQAPAVWLYFTYQFLALAASSLGKLCFSVFTFFGAIVFPVTLLQQGGPLPGPESGLLSNTRKWIVRGDTRHKITHANGYCGAWPGWAVLITVSPNNLSCLIDPRSVVVHFIC